MFESIRSKRKEGEVIILKCRFVVNELLPEDEKQAHNALKRLRQLYDEALAKWKREMQGIPEPPPRNPKPVFNFPKRNQK